VSCAAFRERPDRGGAADAHAHTCPSCRGWLGRQRRAQVALARLAGTFEGEGAPPRVEAALRRAFRERFEPAAAEVAVFGAVPRLRRLSWAFASVTACLVVAIALVLVRKGPAGATRPVAFARPAPATRVAAANEAPRALATLGARRALRAEAASAPRVPPSRPKRRAPSAPPEPPGATFSPADELRAATSSIADSAGPGREADASASASTAAAGPGDTRAFYPLRPEADASRVDSGQVVRVQLRGDVLRAAGLSPALGSGERIEAEVLVGPDGIARGIRLARPSR
jgi:hypothetical protein